MFGLLLVVANASGAQTRLPDVTQDGISIRATWIPMTDGTRRVATLFVPADMPSHGRLPVLLEYLPYRKDESRNHRLGLFSYFVDAGYAGDLAVLVVSG